MINKKLGLNEEQLEFVSCTENKILLLACAGSGKTLSLVRKVGIMISEQRINPEHIFTISFTRAAADELSKRIKLIDRKKGSYVKSMTFHSMCIYFIKKYINKKYTLISENEKNILKENAMKSFNIKDFNKSDNAIRAYKLRLKSLNMLDIELVPDLMLELLNSNDLFREQVQSEVHHLFYDEAQDINEVQYNVLKKIITPTSSATLCLIGDYSQNIYAWNGTNPKFLLDFKSEYNARTITLNKNYRSSMEIVEFSKKFIDTTHAKIDVQGFFNSSPVLYKNLSTREFEIESICRAYNATLENKTIAFITRTNKDIEYISSILLDANIPHTTSLKPSVNKQFIDFARVCINPNSILIESLFNISSEDKIRSFEEDTSIIDIIALKDPMARDILNISYKLKFLNAIDGYNLIKNKFNKYDEFIESELENKDRNFSNLEQFLDFLEMNTDQDNLKKSNVFVSTIYATKGLEYDEVIIFNVNNNNFKEKDEDENLRLLYVAATRAKNDLLITYINDRCNNFNSSIPSESTLLKKYS